MDRFERILRLDQLLRSRRRPVPLGVIAGHLQCSARNAKRVIQDMRAKLGAPLDYDRRAGGYRYATDESAPFQLPGLWFNASELYALLASQRLLSEVQPGLLSASIEPLRKRIDVLLRDGQRTREELSRRVHILHTMARPSRQAVFAPVSTALMQRQRLRVLYHGRSRDRITEREVSPQRLVYYRDNWYLDAWCHLREGIRTFSMDRLEIVCVSDVAAHEVAAPALREHLESAYGIFAGAARYEAQLRFSAEASKWVADEQWHPAQRSEVGPDGCVTLTVPYSNDTELLQEILKYGPDVQVLGPPGLRDKVRARLRDALARYQLSED